MTTKADKIIQEVKIQYKFKQVMSGSNDIVELIINKNNCNCRVILMILKGYEYVRLSIAEPDSGDFKFAIQMFETNQAKKITEFLSFLMY